MWKSRFYGAFVLNRRIGLHAIDATPARWRGDAGSSPPDRARTEHLTHWLISTQVAIIEDAEKRGELKPGMTVVEATSGNTGIAGGLCINQKFTAPSTRRLLNSVKVPVPHCSSTDSLVDLHRR